MTEEKKIEDMSEEEALLALAKVMKDGVTTQEDKHNVHVFLNKVAESKDTTKTANLRVDKDIDELGVPSYPVRAALEMALVSEKIMGNNYFQNYFEKEAEITLATSLSREGFLIKHNDKTSCRYY